MNVVQIKDLVKRYKELVAVDHLTLDIEEGEVFGLLGPNGSGKTTLVQCVLQLLSYDHGTIEIFGQPMNGNCFEIKQKIGFVPQDVAVYDELSVEENIDYFCGLYIEDRKQRKENVQWAMDFVQLGDFRKFRPKKLSGGLLRRLNLACGISHKPNLIFLDEPTVAVDPQSRNKILEGIKDLNRQGATIVYTSHYMEEVEFLCDRLAILDKGKLLVHGQSEEIINMSSIGESISMTIFKLNPAVLEELNHRPGVISTNYENMKLTIKMEKESGGLLSILHFMEEKGLEPVNILGEKPTLNDVFLEITGKELRDHA